MRDVYEDYYKAQFEMLSTIALHVIVFKQNITNYLLLIAEVKRLKKLVPRLLLYIGQRSKVLCLVIRQETMCNVK